MQPKLMVHAVAGYPDLEKSRELIIEMANSGADLIELQIPFSDPLADGPTIMKASQKCIDDGITPKICFELIADIANRITVPILVMTYFNILYRMGVRKFVEECLKSGVCGVIVPDLPFDVRESLEFHSLLDESNIHSVQVISPGMEEKRLKRILKRSGGFVYATLKVGITGAAGQNEESGIAFLKRLKGITNQPVLTGFGISSKEQAGQVHDYCDGIVIGSHLIDIFNQNGIGEVGEFIKSIKSD
jgi:tryptophan synthase alpha chain